MRAILLVGLGFLGAVGCGGGQSGGVASEPGAAPVAATPSAPAVAGGASEVGGGTGGVRPAWDGRGFVVHEWGTDTLVVGSDGSTQVGLHHEEEDLPPFVEDRVRAGLRPSSVEVKMETPVTYFYSDRPRTARVRVRFPRGVFTQWFPRAEVIAPKLVRASEPNGPVVDPLFEPFELRSDRCREIYGTVANGLLDWGSVELLPRDAAAATAAQLPDAPLERTTWSYARRVASNPVRTAQGDVEQFLFYRGLGSFEPPVRVQGLGGRRVRLTSGFAEPMGRVFVVDVGAQAAAFREEAGVGANATLDTSAPEESAREPLAAYEARLGERITEALVAAGLFHDEAVGMVSTWRRQWFRTPGTRVLYLLPQSWTDASIPLDVEPRPDLARRVMLMRVELLTPEIEREDLARAARIASAPGEVSEFVRMGRFGEPRLRRALTLLGRPAWGEAALATVTRPGLVSVARE